jgi:hypothetical protein
MTCYQSKMEVVLCLLQGVTASQNYNTTTPVHAHLVALHPLVLCRSATQAVTAPVTSGCE